MELLPSAELDNQTTASIPRSGSIQAAALYDSQHVSGVLGHMSDSAALRSEISLQGLASAAYSDSANHAHAQAAAQTPAQPASQAGASISAHYSSASQTPASIPAHYSSASQASPLTVAPNSTLAGPSPQTRDLAGLETSALRAAQFKIIDYGLADFREVFGAGYVTAKRDSLIHSRPHRQPSLQSLMEKSKSSSADGQHQQHSSLLSDGNIEWHTGSTPRKLRHKSSIHVPVIMLPEVSNPYRQHILCKQCTYIHDSAY